MRVPTDAGRDYGLRLRYTRHASVLVNYSNPSQGKALTRLVLHNNFFNRILSRYP